MAGPGSPAAGCPRRPKATHMSSDTDVIICLPSLAVQKIGAVVCDGSPASDKFLWARTAEADRASAMAARSAGENFPVALRMLPRSRRAPLMAIYGFARITDDIGDEAPPADRARLLDDGLERLLAYWDGGFEPGPVRRIPIWVAARSAGHP